MFGFSLRQGKLEENDRFSVKNKILTMAAPFVSLFLWHAHCNYVFSAGSTTKHAMTLQNYQNVFSQKTKDDITAICANVFKFSISGKELCDMLLFVGIIGTLSFFLGSQVWKRYLKLIFISIVIYITYMTGVVGTYLFSMGGGEAVGLSGIARYRGTVFIAIYYLFLIFSMTIASSIENKKKGWIYLFGIYAVLLVVWANEGRKTLSSTIKYNYSVDNTRMLFDQKIKEYHVPTGASCLICAPSDGQGNYIWNMCRYLLWTDKVSSLSVTQKSELDDIAGYYEYILIFDENNSYIQEWIRENYSEQQGKTVIVNAR